MVGFGKKPGAACRVECGQQARHQRKHQNQRTTGILAQNGRRIDGFHLRRSAAHRSACQAAGCRAGAIHLQAPAPMFVWATRSCSLGRCRAPRAFARSRRGRRDACSGRLGGMTTRVFAGGPWRNRTAVHRFAVWCLTTRPTDHHARYTGRAGCPATLNISLSRVRIWETP